MRARNTPALLTAAAICVLTLAPLPGPRLPPTLCLACGDRPLAGAVLNVLLFVPLGVAVALRGRGARVLLAGPALSLLVELAQTLIPGRQAALGDLLANSAGAALGIALVRGAALLRRPGAATIAVLALSAAPVPVLAAAATGWLLAPAPPAEWAVGEVRAAEGVWMRMEAGGRERLALGRRGDDVWLRYRTRAKEAGLDQPELAFRGMADGVAHGAVVRVRVGRAGGRWCVRMEDVARCGGPTAGRGWAALAWPDALARRFGGMVDAAWMAMLLLPLGCALRRRPVPLAAATAALIALATLPPVLGLAPSPPGEWAGALAGLAAGMIVARWIRGSGDSIARAPLDQPLPARAPASAEMQRSMRS